MRRRAGTCRCRPAPRGSGRCSRPSAAVRGGPPRPSRSAPGTPGGPAATRWPPLRCADCRPGPPRTPRPRCARPVRRRPRDHRRTAPAPPDPPRPRRRGGAPRAGPAPTAGGRRRRPHRPPSPRPGRRPRAAAVLRAPPRPHGGRWHGAADCPARAAVPTAPTRLCPLAPSARLPVGLPVYRSKIRTGSPTLITPVPRGSDSGRRPTVCRTGGGGPA